MNPLIKKLTKNTTGKIMINVEDLKGLLAVIAGKSNTPVDLRICKPGDLLLTYHGNILEYFKYDTSAYFPHLLTKVGGKEYCASREGYVFSENGMPEDEDIVMILGQ